MIEKKNLKKEIIPFITAFIFLVLIELYLSNGDLLFIAFSVFWKLCLIFLIRFIYKGFAK